MSRRLPRRGSSASGRARPTTPRELAYGGKGVGSQGDGSAQLVVRGAEERARLGERLAGELGLASLPLTLEGAAQAFDWRDTSSR